MMSRSRSAEGRIGRSSNERRGRSGPDEIDNDDDNGRHCLLRARDRHSVRTVRPDPAPWLALLGGSDCAALLWARNESVCFLAVE